MLNVERFSLLSRGSKLTEIKHIQQIIHASSVTRNLATNLLSVIMLGLSMEKKNVNVMFVMIFSWEPALETLNSRNEDAVKK